VNETATLWWNKAAGSLCYIDQTLLPEKFRVVECRNVRRLVKAIRRLEIRGAPALGVSGAYGVALAAQVCRKKNLDAFLSDVYRDAEILRITRPTAVNLGWGIDRVLQKIVSADSIASARSLALGEAEAIAREDTACCHAIGQKGADLLPDKSTVLTHCNAGALACSSWGTALGVVRSATESGKKVSVFACETRPLLQGSRLTAWELIRDGIDVTVITDSAAAFLMRKHIIDAVLVGADRITRDVVFNKVGTYMHAVCARYHEIPFYVAAPLSTFDTRKSEHEVLIEERNREEVTRMGIRCVVPDAAMVKNYAFDATPLDLVTAIITERGVLHSPINIDSVLSMKDIR
jgi:methylthioribose-1-phosphate isomerase